MGWEQTRPPAHFDAPHMQVSMQLICAQLWTKENYADNNNKTSDGQPPMLLARHKPTAPRQGIPMSPHRSNVVQAFNPPRKTH
jgi:hypothetical protein